MTEFLFLGKSFPSAKILLFIANTPCDTPNSDRYTKPQTDKNETLLDLCGVYNTKIKGSLHIQLQTNKHVMCMSNMITCTIFHTWLVGVLSA